MIDQVLLGLVELGGVHGHRVLDPDRQRRLGHRRQRVGALDRRASGVLRIPEVLELVDPAGDLLGVVDQALEPGRQRHPVLLAVEDDPVRVGEREVVPRGDPLGVQRPDQALVEQRLHLVGADLDDVGLEAAGQLRRRLVVGVEGRGLDLQVRVRVGDRVDHLRGHRVLVGEHAQRPRDRGVGIVGSRRDAGLASARPAAGGEHDRADSGHGGGGDALGASARGLHLLGDFVTLVNNLSKSTIWSPMCTLVYEFRAK